MSRRRGKVKYHVNPFSGMPSICRAKKGNCPYGGASGDDYHYDTFQEAQAASQEYMKKNYELLPGHEAYDDEIEEMIVENDDFDYSSLPKEDLIELLETTHDEELLMSVITRHSELSDDWDNLKAVYNNPNLPRNFVERVAKMPNEYTKETQRFMAHSPSMTHDDLMTFIDNAVDADALIIAHRNPNIDLDWMLEQIGDDVENMSNPPIIGFLDNPKLPQKLNEEYHIKVLMNEIEYPSRRDEIPFAKYEYGKVHK